jgi:hypothetical protein
VKDGINSMDCATATILPGIEIDPTTLRDFGHLRGTWAGDLSELEYVIKIGRTSGLRWGRIRTFELDGLMLDYLMGMLRFDGQIEVEGHGPHPFSLPGDSGALVCTEEGYAVGLHFAGVKEGGTNHNGLSYASPITPVLEALQVTLLS